eukprot:TRINITY_DN46374_c0_g1_i1.p1 TRINITY_DN46374_c0_g1~~TRINITY_DN46374_c0_g1_i1.p1  ORF type:complete len:210 (+),score=15.49 TRINITY_DN46374_c0_g1_i1:2-631(+)
MFLKLEGISASSLEKVDGKAVVESLNSLYSEWDTYLKTRLTNLEKVKNIGETYMLIGNRKAKGQESASNDAAHFMMEMLDFSAFAVSTLQNLTLADATEGGISVQMGAHIGSAMGTVLDTERPLYDVFGDTVNTAARLTTNSPRNNQLHISAAFHSRLIHSEQVADCISGPFTVEMKGKEATESWLVDPAALPPSLTSVSSIMVSIPDV